MLHHFHGVPKHDLARKAFGCFRHRNCAPASPYLRGFSDDFVVPVSRWTEIRAEDLPAGRGLEVLMSAAETGPCLLEDPAHRALYMFNHVEYDTDSLKAEYDRISRAARRSSCRSPTSRATIRPGRRRTAGGAMRICSSATG